MSNPTGIERRFTSVTATPRGGTSRLTFRATTRQGSHGTLFGFASVFWDGTDGTQYRIDQYTVERILPGAFDRALREQHDARALFNHSADNLLGRVSAGTLRLSANRIGLRYEVDLADTRVGTDVAKLVERGDLSGSSFAFIPTRTTWKTEGALEIREVRDLDLFDVGPVVFPAYEGTATSVVIDERGKRSAAVDVRSLRLSDRERLVEHIERQSADIPKELRAIEERERMKRLEASL